MRARTTLGLVVATMIGSVRSRLCVFDGECIDTVGCNTVPVCVCAMLINGT